MRTSSTVGSSLRLIGTSRLCVYTGLSSFGFKLILKCVFIQMSSVCRAKMSLNSTIVSSRFSRSFGILRFQWGHVFQVRLILVVLSKSVFVSASFVYFRGFQGLGIRVFFIVFGSSRFGVVLNVTLQHRHVPLVG